MISAFTLPPLLPRLPQTALAASVIAIGFGLGAAPLAIAQATTRQPRRPRRPRPPTTRRPHPATMFDGDIPSISRSTSAAALSNNMGMNRSTTPWSTCNPDRAFWINLWICGSRSLQSAALRPLLHEQFWLRRRSDRRHYFEFLQGQDLRLPGKFPPLPAVLRLRTAGQSADTSGVEPLRTKLAVSPPL